MRTGPLVSYLVPARKPQFLGDTHFRELDCEPVCGPMSLLTTQRGELDTGSRAQKLGGCRPAAHLSPQPVADLRCCLACGAQAARRSALRSRLCRISPIRCRFAAVTASATVRSNPALPCVRTRSRPRRSKLLIADSTAGCCCRALPFTHKSCSCAASDGVCCLGRDGDSVRRLARWWPAGCSLPTALGGPGPHSACA